MFSKNLFDGSGKESSVKIQVESAAPFILLSSVLNKPGIGAKICDALASRGINLESFITVSAPGKERADILIEVADEDLPEANYLLSKVAREIEAKGLLSPGLYVEELVALVIQGPGLEKRAGIAAKIFKIFSKYNVNVWAFTAKRIEEESEIKALVEKRHLNEHPEIIEEIEKIV